MGRCCVTSRAEQRRAATLRRGESIPMGGLRTNHWDGGGGITPCHQPGQGPHQRGEDDGRLHRCGQEEKPGPRPCLVPPPCDIVGPGARFGRTGPGATPREAKPPRGGGGSGSPGAFGHVTGNRGTRSSRTGRVATSREWKVQFGHTGCGVGETARGGPARLGGA